MLAFILKKNIPWIYKVVLVGITLYFIRIYPKEVKYCVVFILRIFKWFAKLVTPKKTPKSKTIKRRAKRAPKNFRRVIYNINLK